MAITPDVLPFNEDWEPPKTASSKKDFDLGDWVATTEAPIARDLRARYLEIMAQMRPMSLNELRAARNELNGLINRFTKGYLVPDNPDFARFANPHLAVAMLGDEYINPNQPDGQPRAQDVIRMLDERITEMEKRTRDAKMAIVRTRDADLRQIEDEFTHPDYTVDNGPRTQRLQPAIEAVRTRLGTYDPTVLDEINTILDRAERRLADLRRAKTERPKTQEDIKKDSVIAFLNERYLPTREEGESIDDYLARLYIGMMGIMRGTIWNKERDQNSEPYTENYKTNPMSGPRKAMIILNHTQSYDPMARIQTLGAFWDQFPAYFDNPADKKTAMEFAERQKRAASEISIWHNRAWVRKQNYDAGGPEGAFKAHDQIFKSSTDPEIAPLFVPPEHEVMTLQEKAQAKAYEFFMGLWSVKSLTETERNRLTKADLIHHDILPFLEPAYEKMVPPFLTDMSDEARVEAIEKMIKVAEGIIQAAEGIPEAERGRPENSRLTSAEVAFHQGEVFRIASDIEAELDRSYTVNKKGERVAKVAAIEGEAKTLNIGLYVESAGENEARPDFNQVFAKYLVHGYPTYGRALQVKCDFHLNNGSRYNISDIGDDQRASLVEILSVDGAIEHVDWSTKSTDPDRTVAYASAQAFKALWPRAQISRSLEQANQFFIDPAKIPIAGTQILNQPDEIEKLRIMFGTYGERLKMTRRTVENFVPGRNTLDEYETIGFDADSKPLSGERLQHIKTFYKDSRDYWIAALTADAGKYPFDVIRTMRYMFSRDDRPENNGYVNPKIQQIVEDYRTPIDPDGTILPMEDWVKKILVPNVTAYVTNDLLLRSVFYLLEPDFRTVETHHPIYQADGKTPDPHAVEEAYRTLDFNNFEEYQVTSRSGAELVNTARLAYVINQASLLREAFKDEQARFAKAGYRLFGDNPEGKVYTRLDLLRLAQEFHLGEGYAYYKVKRNNNWFAQLNRIPGGHVTAQYLVDREVLMEFLFHKKEH